MNDESCLRQIGLGRQGMTNKEDGESGGSKYRTPLNDRLEGFGILLQNLQKLVVLNLLPKTQVNMV